MLHDTWITAIVHCAPPQNKPTTEERNHCLPFFYRELVLLRRVQVVIALGKFGWDGFLRAMQEQGQPIKPKPAFGHGAEAAVGPYTLLGSFHPSQQNTFTKRLTEPMFDAVFDRARQILC